MGYRLLAADDAFWRPSNQMGVMNTDLAKQLGSTTLGARLWRLEMTPERLAWMYPDGPKALPPELGGGQAP
jgi:hypothetical protein